MKQLITLSLLLLFFVPVVNATNLRCSEIELPNTIKDTSSSSIKCISVFHDLMRLTHHYGSLIGFPETMQAILLQETQGGRIRTNKHQEIYEWAAYGVMQIQPKTAQYTLECILHKDEIPDENTIKLMLKTNDNFNIHLSTVYFKYLYDKYVSRGNHTGVAWRMAVLAYNIGPGKLKSHGMAWDPNEYLDGIRKNLKVVRAYNNAYGL